MTPETQVGEATAEDWQIENEMMAEEACPDCKGRGTVTAATCPTCEGSGAWP